MFCVEHWFFLVGFYEGSSVSASSICWFFRFFLFVGFQIKVVFCILYFSQVSLEASSFFVLKKMNQKKLLFHRISPQFRDALSVGASLVRQIRQGNG